jgi:hypothetical protein
MSPDTSSSEQEEDSKKADEMFNQALDEVGEDAKEAKRRGIPLHDLPENWREEEAASGS